MRTQTSAVTLVLSLLVLAVPVSAQELLPLQAGDLAADTVLAPSAPTKALAAPREAIPREAVSVHRALDKNARLDAATAAFTSRSKEYFVDLTAADLERGVPIYTSQPGALVRLNPAPGSEAASLADKAAIAPSALVLASPDGRELGGAAGMDLVVGPAQLKAAGAPFVAGTSAFRIREDLGAGTFQLRAAGLDVVAGDRYVMHVLDQRSDVELQLRTGASDYLHGQTLTVEATLAGAGKVRTRTVEGFVTSPAGRAWELTFEPVGGGRFVASLELDALEAPQPGLWEAHASARGRSGRHAILRAGKTAFSCGVPSARLAGADEVVSSPDGVSLRLAVEVASASRYELSGVLYGTDSDGALKPAGIARSAAWLEAGAESLALSFSTDATSAQGLGAPFEVRHLRLADQAAMALLHRQARALRITD